jgi:hypothetical protein
MNAAHVVIVDDTPTDSKLLADLLAVRPEAIHARTPRR